MKPAARLVMTLLTLTPLAACDDGRSRPIPGSPLPSAPSLPTPPPASMSQITIRSIAPGSGATLTVRECPFSFTSNFKDLCAERLQMTVDVEFGSSVSNAVVTASFYSGTTRCGIAYSGSAPFAAGSRAFELLGTIALSDEYLQLHCPLPAQTTRMVIQLWERSTPAGPLLIREFAHNYTFAEP